MTLPISNIDVPWIQSTTKRALLHRSSRLSHEIRVPKSTQGGFSPGKSVITLPRSARARGPALWPQDIGRLSQEKHKTETKQARFTLTFGLLYFPLFSLLSGMILPIFWFRVSTSYLRIQMNINESTVHALDRFVFLPITADFVVKSSKIAIKIFWLWELYICGLKRLITLPPLLINRPR